MFPVVWMAVCIALFLGGMFYVGTAENPYGETSGLDKLGAAMLTFFLAFAWPIVLCAAIAAGISYLPYLLGKKFARKA